MLAQGERLLDAQPAAPEHDDKRPQPSAVAIVARLTHHGDDLLHRRWVRGIQLPLVAGRATGVIAGHGRGRAPPTGGIENSRDGHGISSQSHSGQSPPLYQRSRDGGRHCAGDRVPLASRRRCVSRRFVTQAPDARPRRAWRRAARGARCFTNAGVVLVPRAVASLTAYVTDASAGAPPGRARRRSDLRRRTRRENPPRRATRISTPTRVHDGRRRQSALRGRSSQRASPALSRRGAARAARGCRRGGAPSPGSCP